MSGELRGVKLALALYDGEVDSSFLREPLPPPHPNMPPGAVDNQFKLLVDILIARREQMMAQERKLPV